MRFIFFIASIIININTFAQDTINIELICGYKMTHIYFYDRDRKSIFNEKFINSNRKLVLSKISAQLIKEKGHFKEGETIQFWIARKNLIFPIKKWHLISVNFESKSFLIIQQDYRYKRKYQLIPKWSDQDPICI
jgi:hypothetical protein